MILLQSVNMNMLGQDRIKHTVPIQKPAEYPFIGLDHLSDNLQDLSDNRSPMFLTIITFRISFIQLFLVNQFLTEQQLSLKKVQRILCSQEQFLLSQIESRDTIPWAQPLAHPIPSLIIVITKILVPSEKIGLGDYLILCLTNGQNLPQNISQKDVNDVIEVCIQHKYIDKSLTNFYTGDPDYLMPNNSNQQRKYVCMFVHK